MEDEIYFSETFVFIYQTTRCHNTEHHNLCRRQNLPPNFWYRHTRLHGVTPQKTTIWIFNFLFKPQIYFFFCTRNRNLCKKSISFHRLATYQVSRLIPCCCRPLRLAAPPHKPRFRNSFSLCSRQKMALVSLYTWGPRRSVLPKCRESFSFGKWAASRIILWPDLPLPQVFRTAPSP